MSDFPAIWEFINDGDPYDPWDWQAEHIHTQAHKKRLILACGRRAGKTTAIKAEIVREALQPRKEQFGVYHAPYIYVIAPNYELTMKVWEPVWNLFVGPGAPLRDYYAGHDKTRKLVELQNGARIQAKSADDPTSLQGDRVTAAFVDEAHDLNPEAWANFMPALADSDGRLVAIGIARGKGNFRTYWQVGQEQDPRYYSASVTSLEHPNIDEAALEEFKRDLTDAQYRQQYLAEWVEDDGTVFKNFDECFDSEWEEPQESHYLMGLDLGKIEDYTVAYVVDIGRMQFVATDRFNGLDYTLLGPRIANLYKRDRCQTVHLDGSGIGEPVADMLRNEGCAVSSFKFTNDSKARLVSTLAAEVEHGRVHFGKNDEVLKKEMELFEGSVLPGGGVKYSHPPGYHDDAVMAAGLAVMKAKKRQGTASGVMRRDYVTFG
jgi:phage terminase large subunit-like protein